MIVVCFLCKDLNKRLDTLEPSNDLGLRSQDSFLERNLQSKQAEVFDLIEEGELEVSVRENGDVIPEKEANERSIMDGNTYRNHVVKFKNEARKVKRKINDYTAEKVHIIDANNSGADPPAAKHTHPSQVGAEEDGHDIGQL